MRVVQTENKMEKWRSWWWCKNTILFPTKRLVFSITSRLTQKAKGRRRHGLVNLYKDMESCRGYEDIQVMWEMLHSSYPPRSRYNSNQSSKSFILRFCFRPA